VTSVRDSEGLAEEIVAFNLLGLQLSTAQFCRSCAVEDIMCMDYYALLSLAAATVRCTSGDSDPDSESKNNSVTLLTRLLQFFHRQDAPFWTGCIVS
jgi:hypothetical protein